MTKVLATIGKRAVHAPAYVETDWQERDNFVSLDAARGYADFKSRQYPQTPYRIVKRLGRFSVQFVPEWKLRGEGN